MPFRYYDIEFNFPTGEKVSYEKLTIENVLTKLPEEFKKFMNAEVKSSRNIIYNIINDRPRPWIVKNYCSIKYNYTPKCV